MKIAHIADLHLGKKMENLDRNPELLDTLNEICQVLKKEKIDVLLIAGDIFDTARPSVESQEIFYRFLRKVLKSGVEKVFIVAGNHDNKALLEVASEFLLDSGIHVWGQVSKNIDDYFYSCKIKGEELLVAGLPYLDEYQVLSEILIKTGEEKISDAQKYNRVYRSILELFKDRAKSESGVKVFMGHLFVENARFSHSEKSSSLEDWLCIPRETLEESNPFDYMALGHIHRAQRLIDSLYSIYYSGSIIRLSFKEKKEAKGFYIYDSQQRDAKFIELETPFFLKEMEAKVENEDDLKKLTDMEQEEKTLLKLKLEYSGGMIPVEIRQRLYESFGQRVRLELIPARTAKDSGDSVEKITGLNSLLEYYQRFKGEAFKEELGRVLKNLAEEELEF